MANSFASVDFLREGDSLDALCEHVAHRLDGDVGLTYDWMRSLIESDTAHRPYLSVVIESKFGDGGVVALVRRRERVCRIIPSIALMPLSSIYSTRGGMAASCDADAWREFFQFLARQSTWDRFSCTLEEGSSVQHELLTGARKGGFYVSATPFEVCPTLKLPDSAESFLGGKSSNFRQTVRRKSRKLEAAGAVTVEMVAGEDGVAAALADILEIERCSWKMESNTAIVSSDSRVAFYSKLAVCMARRGWLRLYILKFDGKAIAFDYGLFFDGRYYMLKTSYDEAFGELSPGVYLRWHVIQDLILAGASEHNFLWGAEPYKLQWSTDQYRYTHHVIYNKTLRGKLQRWCAGMQARMRFIRAGAGSNANP